MNTKTPSHQLDYWRGSFGADYMERNPLNEESVRMRVPMWSRIMRCMQGAPPRSMLEVGANVGINLCALRTLTSAEMFGVEPNNEARSEMLKSGVLGPENVKEGHASNLPFESASMDCVFTSGVLIHISPDDLGPSVDEIHRVSRKYIVCIEYFSPNPEQIHYRGHSDLLFKRDYGQYYLDRFQDIELLDYGFFWKRATGLDNLTWWAFRKHG